MTNDPARAGSFVASGLTWDGIDDFVPSVTRGTSARETIVDATVRCIDQWGVAKTTLDDVAAEAGIGRSTVYRIFPGGKAALIDAVTEHEVARYVDEFEARVSAPDDLEGTLVEALVIGAEALLTWPALRDLVVFRSAPEAGVTTEHSQQVLLDSLQVLFTPHLHRYLDPRIASRVVDWAARLALSYATVRTNDPDHDLTDPAAARRLVDQLILPAIHAMQLTPVHA